jgi:hypothetical protein
VLVLVVQEAAADATRSALLSRGFHPTVRKLS